MISKPSINKNELKYIKSQLFSAADAKLDLFLPAGPEVDPLRERVRQLVYGFINESVLDACGSVIVDGIEGIGPDQIDAILSQGEEVEPVDLELAAQVDQLQSEIDGELVGLAQARHKAPRALVDEFNSELDSFKRELEHVLDSVEIKPESEEETPMFQAFQGSSEQDFGGSKMAFERACEFLRQFQDKNPATQTNLTALSAVYKSLCGQ